MRMNTQIDVRDVLPSIQAPTLSCIGRDDRDVNVEEGRWIAARRSRARSSWSSRETPTLLWAGDADEIVDEVEEFLTGARRGPEPDRVLATVLFTDIVGSTERAAELGDRRWRELLERHHALGAQQLERYRGRRGGHGGRRLSRHVRRPGPGDPVRLGSRDRRSRALGLEIRAGVHTGECELFGDKVGGFAVHIGRAGRQPGRRRARSSSRRPSRTSSPAPGSSSRIAARTS